MTRFILATIAVALSACASVETMPLSKDSFALTSTGMGGCGARGAERVAFQQAAAETLRRGYDGFVIMHSEREARLDSASSLLWTAASGGVSYNHTFSQGMKVQMFKDGEPGSEKAISARETLGPNWQVALNAETTYDCDMFG